jgi:hypothetical protein
MSSLRPLRPLLLVLISAFSWAQDDDLAKRVKSLVAELQFEELQAAEEALDALAKLGPAALPALRAELEKAAGDTKLKIESVIKRITRRAKIDEVMGRPVLVTINATCIPGDDVLADLQKQSDQPMTFKDIPFKRVTVATDKKPFWEALDAICKAHGDIMWRVHRDGVVVEKGKYRARPMVVQGNVALYFDGHTTSKTVPGNDGTFWLEGAVAWTRGSRPSAGALAVAKLEDDKATNLLTDEDPGDHWTWEAGQDPDGAVVGSAAEIYAYVLPHDEAEKLAHCSGSLKLSYVLAMKKILSVKDPANSKGTVHTGGTYTVQLQDASVAGRDAAVTVQVTYPGEGEERMLAGFHFALVDTAGGSHRPRVESQGTSVSHDGKSMHTTETLLLRWKLPEKCAVATLDMLAPDDVEEVTVPFNFPGLPLR